MREKKSSITSLRPVVRHRFSPAPIYYGPSTPRNGARSASTTRRPASPAVRCARPRSATFDGLLSTTTCMPCQTCTATVSTIPRIRELRPCLLCVCQKKKKKIVRDVTTNAHKTWAEGGCTRSLTL